MYLFFKKGEKKQFVSFDSTLMARQVASSLFYLVSPRYNHSDIRWVLSKFGSLGANIAVHNKQNPFEIYSTSKSTHGCKMKYEIAGNNNQAGQWVDIIDHWSIIDHFA